MFHCDIDIEKTALMAAGMTSATIMMTYAGGPFH